MDAAGWFPGRIPVTLRTKVSRSSTAWCLTDPTTLRRCSGLSIIREKRNGSAFWGLDGPESYDLATITSVCGG